MSSVDVNELLAGLAVPDLYERLALVDARIVDTLRVGAAELAGPCQRVAGSGGKRLRPALVVACAHLGGMFDDRVVAGAAAVELVQVGSLVHDDIFESAATRRGTPTINAVEGDDVALIAGDYILARAGVEASTVGQEAAGLLARTIVALCEGQVAEMRDVGDVDRTQAACMRSIEGKTAALFSASCRMGALAAGLPAATADALAAFGHQFGIAFQVLDDVLDVTADPVRLGKPVGIDIATGVYTLPVLFAMDGDDGDELRRILRRRDANDVVAAMQLVRRSDGIDRALRIVDHHIVAAVDALDALDSLDSSATVRGLAALAKDYVGWALDYFTAPASRATRARA